MVRQTWPNHLKNQSNIYNQLDVVGFGFIVGLTRDRAVQQNVMEENDNYGDILQINTMDKYVNLSMKVAGLLNWVDNYCPGVDYVLKVDDDVYVNVHNLATILHSLSPSERSVYGRQCGGNLPARSGGKWPTSFENWPWQRFPLYFQGAAIVIAGSAVRPILAAIQTTPYFIWDDMYLIGLCAVKARILLRTSNQIFIEQPDDYADPCFVRNSIMWTTPNTDGMHSSHSVSHNFYHQHPKTAHCHLIRNRSTYTDDPATAAEFPFSLAKQN
ncbi:lactosylceramide 1,3-N-acetyl-beta-D-glucosaminyltransferase B-like [Daphnia pulicaria]|uniref:lactosylceramide 1,3-N-acetyl-beta-D-glucosaminyltransferase B-like n=1 Tax=Daphnia pulicaria TaxID=35523 RepID=UPI001EE9B500|nr:lactosylceramide 1,3-N-acetyl-beta-D-glucosaminyltransferase B-like [Daphnia pulicaria]